MNPIYNTGIILYSNAVRLASTKNNKARLMVEGHKKVFNYLKEKFSDQDSPIWIHASSLGEFEQGRPMIEMIRRQYPGTKILLTFFSPSGYEVRKNYKDVDAVCYLPFDTPANAKKFVDIVNPRAVIFVKYEFWGNYLTTLKSRNIPTFLISAIFRTTQTFFKWYGGMFRNMLKCFTTIYVQDEASRELLAGINCNNVKVVGDTRFDRVTNILEAQKSFPNVQEFAERKPTIIIGSSWQPDEDIVINYFNTHLEWNLIIAPHEFNEARLNGIKDKLTRSVQCYSELNKEDSVTADTLIIDCFGILSSCYRYANVAYIGGGFGAGIHNINEAAVYGIPVLFGPKHNKFKEAQDLLHCGGAFEITTQESFNEIIDMFNADNSLMLKAGEQCHKYIESNIGATKKIFADIEKYF